MGSSVELARARRKRQAAAQAAKEREAWNKAKKPLLIALAVVAVLVVGVLLFNEFYVAPGHLKVRNGSMQGAQENWLVVNVGTSSRPDCLHVADVTTPAGFTLDPTYNTFSYGTSQTRYYNANDDTAPVRAIYATGVANTKPAENIQRLMTTGYFTPVGEPVTQQIGGKEVTWLLTTSTAIDENGNEMEGQSTGALYAYTDRPQGGCISVVLMSRSFPTEEPYTPEVYMPLLEEVISGLTIR